MSKPNNAYRLLSRFVLIMSFAGLFACSSVHHAGNLSPDSTEGYLSSDRASAYRQLSLPESEKRCAGSSELTDEFVAKSTGLSIDDLLLLKGRKNLSNADICRMPVEKLARAIYKSKHPDHPEEWAKLRAMQQASEDGTVKPDGLANALAERKAMLDATSDITKAVGGISSSQWTFLGPGNIGGRIRSIVVHPTSTNTIFIGGVSGGIWKTTNGGTSWSPVNDFMGNLAVNSIAMDPSNSNILYAATGEGFFNTDAVRGYGIFKSTDGGDTWSHLSSTTPSSTCTSSASAYNWYYVNRVAVSSTGVVLAGTGGCYGNYGGIYRSTDGGATWTQTFQGRVLQVVFDPSNPNNALANGIDYNSTSGSWESHILRSTNAGQTWTKVKTFANNYNSRIEVAYALSNTQTIYASYDHATSNSGQIYKSTNGGSTWTLLSTPGHLQSQGWYDNSIWVSPTDPNLVVIGGIDLYRSTNGGITWEQISIWWKWPTSAHADQHAIVSHPGFNGTSNKTVFFGNDGGIWKADDITSSFTISEFYGGTLYTSIAWTNLNNSLGITQFYGGAGSAGTGKIIGGTQDNGHLMYTGSSTWAQTNGGDGGFAAVDPTNSSYMYGEYVYLNVYRSTDGGNNYTNICSGITDANSTYCGGNDDSLFIAPFILDPNNSNTMLAGAASLWRSTNVKAATPSWSAIKTPVYSGAYKKYISAIAVAQGNSNVIWAGHENGDVYYTTNGTNASPTWTKVDGTTLPNRYVTRILIDNDNSSKVYVAFGGYEADNLYVTTNSGGAWTDISGNIPSAPVRTIVRHPTNANWLYAGTEVGIYATEDGGATWSTTNDGPANVSVDELFWYNSTQLAAATHGRGMFMVTIGTTSCTYTISPTSQTFTSTGGTGSVTVTPSASSCTWTASESLDWVTITSGASGTGSGTVSYTVSTNSTGAARTGNITIAGQTFTITQTDTIFADVSSSNGFYNYINAIYNAGITVGCSTNPLKYCPDDSVTRGQMAAFIIRANYGETFSYTTTPYFSDVLSSNVFFKYVQKMKDLGITAVTGTYGINDVVTRGQMAAFIIRAKYGETFSYTTTPYFSDVPATDVFFKYVQKMKDAGITAVTGTYGINDVVTRGQMAAFIARAFLGMP